MSCVHNWSPTSLHESVPETGYNLKKKFAEKHLYGEVKEKYLEEIKPVQPRKFKKGELQLKLKKIDVRKDMRTLDDILKENELSEKQKKPWEQGEENKKKEAETKKQESLEEKVKAQISDDNREYYRWLSGLSSDRPAAFSRKWAQRWVCKRAYELGWTEELFSDFEEYCSYGRGDGPSGEDMERVGKKYQWIAFHELLARLSDNVHWIDRGYSDVEDKHYYGPWQMNKRDIDPTILIRNNGEFRSFYNEVITWWQPYRFPLPTADDIPSKKTFLWDNNMIPNFSDLLRVGEPDTHNQWTVLRGFWAEKQRESGIKANLPRLDCWFRINSVFIRKRDYKLVEKSLKNKRLTAPYTIGVPSTAYQGYLGEYPWHSIYKFMSGWRHPDSNSDLIPTEYFIPISEYKWESGDGDYSLDGSLSFYLPAKELVENLCLRINNNDFGSWKNDNEVIFCDPSIKQYGPSYALMDSQRLDEWLDKNGLDILWLIGGEKQLFSHMDKFYGRLVYSGLFKSVKGLPTGSLWFEREDPNR